MPPVWKLKLLYFPQAKLPSLVKLDGLLLACREDKTSFPSSEKWLQLEAEPRVMMDGLRT